MEPITTTALILAKVGKALLIGAAIGAVIVVALLTGSMIRDYVRKKRTEKNAKVKTAILKQKLESGEYEVNAAFFEEDGAVSDVRTWRAKDVDAEVAGLPIDKVILSAPL